MGEKWQVVVSRWTEDDGWIEEAQLIAPREALTRFAPGVVAEALGANTHAANAFLVPEQFRDALVAEPVPGVTPVPAMSEQDKPKRTRRTKAQIEADRLAEQTAAEVAVTNGGNDPYPDADAVPNGNEAPAVPFNPFAPK